MIVGLVACGQSNNEPTSPATMPSESTAPTEESTAPPTTIPVHEHVYTEITTDATCTEEGKLVKTCECGEVVEEILNEYTYMFYATKPMSYGNFLDFFKEAGNPV